MVLTIKNLSKQFNTHPIIKNLSFTIDNQQRVTLFARSGAGKSTLINILTRLDPHYEGSFTLTARRPTTIFQEPRLFPYMTIQENIFLPFNLRGQAITPQHHRLYTEWLEVCQLNEYTHCYPHQLSGGMKQKVALIRGFLIQPDFVMMDEPFRSIDQTAKQAIINHLLTYHADIPMLFVTHNRAEIPLLAHTVLSFSGAWLQEFTQHEARNFLIL